MNGQVSIFDEEFQKEVQKQKDLKETPVITKTYWSQNVADTLRISKSTLRKWCGIVEDAGYSFLRDEFNRRAFTDFDVQSLQEFKDLTTSGSKLEEAAKEMVTYRQRPATHSTSLAVKEPDKPEVGNEKLYELIQQMKNHIEIQEKFNQELLLRLEERDKQLEKVLQKRDQEWIQVIEELKETRFLLQAAQKNIEEQPKKKWWMIWK